MSEIAVCAATTSARPFSVIGLLLLPAGPPRGPSYPFPPTARTPPARASKAGAGTRRYARAVTHNVTLIPGDGVGPELSEATRRVLEATGVEFEWDVQHAGADVMDQFGGNPLPEQTLDSIRRTGVAIKGPITTPVGGGFRSVNVGLRKDRKSVV